MKHNFFRKAAFLCALLLSSLTFFGAQENDSLSFVTARWKTSEIGEHITLKEIAFPGNLFNSNQYICIIEVSKNRTGKSKIPYFCFAAGEELTKTSAFAEKKGGVAAVNGTFFKFNKPHNAVDYLRIDGVEICPNGDESKGKRAFSQLGVIAIAKKGLAILKPEDDINWERELKEPDIMTSGPLLIYKDRCEPLQQSAFYKNRHPRTAVATFKDGRVMLITVDGRNGAAQGMSLEELQKIGKWMGASELLNLDGGGSTAMYIQGKGIVNHPSDNKLFDHNGERSVANALLLMVSH